MMDALTERNGYTIVKCAGCGLEFVSPMPTQEELLQYYSAQGNEDCGILETVDDTGRVVPEPWKFAEMERLADLLTELSPPGRLLDVGCLWGLFLEVVQRRGWQVEGLEPCEKAANYGLDRLGLTIYTGTLDTVEYPAKSFSAVVLWDVIEHFCDPDAQLRRIHHLLKDDGVLGLGTPNGGALLNSMSRLAHQLRRRTGGFSSLWPPHHLFEFTPGNLGRLLRKHGFDMLQTHFASTFDTTQAVSAHKKSGLRTLARIAISRWGTRIGRGDRMFVFARKVSERLGS
jgi:SAM-dependent methyltransferase